MELLRKLRERLATQRMTALLRSGTGPLELGMFSRTLLRATLVGVVAGIVGAAFTYSIQTVSDLVLEEWAGARLLHATSEPLLREPAHPDVPWLILVIPAAGALLAGLITRWAPDARGGGADRAIATYHHHGARVAPLLLPAKFLASLLTLGSGGAGGREGPSMQIGAAVGSAVSRWLPTSERERRLLYVAGIGAGMSAVFQTPLGAAVLSAELLYRDDFEADALVPSMLASVVSFAVSYTVLGTQPFFGDLPRYPFVVAHLPLYAAMAVVLAAFGAAFVWMLHAVREVTRRSGLPPWLAPAAGGLLLGGMVVAFHLLGLHDVGPAPVDSALLRGGYGVVQLALGAVTGPSLAMAGWLALLAVMRMASASLTVGSGGSAGDFAPSVVVGGLAGAAFGHLAATLFPEAAVQPATFALVGMATFYGGVAHVPLGAMIMVSELAGTYDLLVPLMMGTIGAHVLLRRVQLYGAQLPGRVDAAPAATGSRPDEG